jgi:hypothetical protein
VLRIIDVAEILGVTYQRVQQIHKAGRLPEPAKRDEIGPLWRKSDIVEWARAEWWGTYRWRVRPANQTRGR